MAMPKYESDIINSAGIHGEDLIIAFQREIQPRIKVVVDLDEQPMKEGFVSMQKNHIISISEVILHSDDLLNPMVEIREVEIGEILRQVIADGHTICAVDNLVEKFKGVLAFYLSADDLF